MELKYLEWNLHAMGGLGYTIPSFITDYIKKVDAFVLVEFCASDGFGDFRKKLTEYDLYCSPYTSKGYNQVCIGIRKSLKYNLLSIVSVDVCDANIPEYLQVDIKIDEKKISLIGTRIKTQSNTKQSQYDFLKMHLSSVDSYICLGDFNAFSKYINNNLSSAGDVYGPRILNDYYSHVQKNGDGVALDWLITKNIKKVFNGYEDSFHSPMATYDWSFITEANGYGKKCECDYLGIRGLPDHAILKGMIEI